MKIRADFICLICAVGLAIIFACLISVWRGFAIFTGASLCVASVIFTYWRYQKYSYYKQAIEEQKYQDAYVYAEENDTNFDPDHFAYSKKDERQITANLRSLKSVLWAGVGLCAGSTVLIVLGFMMVL